MNPFLLPRNSQINENGFLVVRYDKYKAEITPADEIYWQLCQEFGKREVDSWDDDTYYEAWAALCVINEHAEEYIKRHSKGK